MFNMEENDKEIQNVADNNPAKLQQYTTKRTASASPLPATRQDGLAGKIMWTGIVFFAHACLGLLISSLGPAFLDLLLILGENIEKGSIIFTSQGVGGVTGGLLSGVLYDRFSTKAIFSIALLICAIVNVIIPYCIYLWLMCVVVAVRGLLMYLMVTGCALICVRTWRDSEGTSMMQALHFTFSVGGVIGPFITSEFLVERPDDNIRWNTTGVPETSDNRTTSLIVDESQIHVAFLIISIITALGSLFCFALMFYERSGTGRAQTETADKEETKYTAVKKKSNLSLPVRIAFFTFVVLYFMMSVAIETLNQNYIPTFVVTYFDWTKTEGARIASAFWGAFAAGRFVGIFAAKLLTPWKFMGVDLIFLFVAAVVLVIAVDMHYIVIWIWVSVSGIFIAGLYACGCSFVDVYIMRLSGKIYSIFLVAETASSMIYPVILGSLIENYSPIWFVYLALIICSLCVLVFIGLSVMVAKWGKGKRGKENEIEMTNK